MNQKIVLDASVWIRFARSKDLLPLVSRFLKYKLTPVINSYLLSEVFDALIKNEWSTEKQASKLTDAILILSILISENVVYRLSPDPKDNYLFDIAIQHKCSFVISDDKELLSFRLRPVKVKSTNWFLKNFPV